MEDLIYQFAAGTIAILLAYVTARIEQRTGIQIEAYDRDSIDKALRNGVALVKDESLTTEAKIDVVQDYVKDAAKDAVTRFAKKGLTDAKLRQLAQSAIAAAKT